MQDNSEDWKGIAAASYWIEFAGAFDPDAVRKMVKAKITWEEARIVPKDKDGFCRQTIGYEVSNGDLSIDEALEIIKRQSDEIVSRYEEMCDMCGYNVAVQNGLCVSCID